MKIKTLFLKTLMMPMLAFPSVALYASPEQVFLGVKYVDPDNADPEHRLPVARPTIMQEEHILYFSNLGYDMALILVDDEGNDVYSTIVPVGSTSVMLPSTLNGSYELRLYPGGSFYFFSDIIL